MTKLEFVNKFIFQLFFARLTRCQERIIDKVDFYETSITPDGFGWGGNVRESHIEQWYSIMFWVVPFTGWNSKFKFIGKQQLKRITKKAKL